MKLLTWILAAFTCAIAQAQSPIGSYSMSLWAHTNLNVNRELESGAKGKVLGYTTNGIIGLLDMSGGTNTVPEAPADSKLYGRSNAVWQAFNPGISNAPVDGNFYAQSNAVWKLFTIPNTSGLISEAPLGTSLYARSNALWQVFPPGLSTMPSDAPNNGLWYSRRNGEWQNFLPSGGGTSGGTNRMKVAALAEWRPAATDGTLIPSATNTFIKLNHIYDPDGLFTGVNTNTGSFRLTNGNYAVTMVVPISVAEQGGGNVRIPFSIGLFNLTTTNDVYYQTYTIYDEDLSQYSQVFMPFVITDGLQEFTIRVVNHHATIDLRAGQAGGVVDNRYSEVQLLKLDGLAGLPEAPINSSLYARSNQDWLAFTIPSTNGFIPEAPTDGQTYGRRGSDASWQLVTGGGGPANVVIGVDDIATLTNTVVPDPNGIERVLVSNPTNAVGTFYQLRLRAQPVATPYRQDGGISYTDNGDGSHTVVGDGNASLKADNGVTGPGRIRMAYDVRMEPDSGTDLVGTIILAGGEGNPVWYTDLNITTNWSTKVIDFDVPGLMVQVFVGNTSSPSSFTVRNWVWIYTSQIPSESTPGFPSNVDPFYVWQQIAITSSGGGGGADTNVVGGFLTEADLRASPLTYSKAIVGTNLLKQTLYSKLDMNPGYSVDQWAIATGSAPTTESKPTGSAFIEVAVQTVGASGGIYSLQIGTIPGNHYLIKGSVQSRTQAGYTALAPSPRWANVVWDANGTNMTLAAFQNRNFSVQFDATSTNDFELWMYSIQDATAGNEDNAIWFSALEFLGSELAKGFQISTMPEAPILGLAFARQDAAWVQVTDSALTPVGTNSPSGTIVSQGKGLIYGQTDSNKTVVTNLYVFDGVVGTSSPWLKYTPPVSEAPMDSQLYARSNGVWKLFTIPSGGGLTTKSLTVPAENYQFVPDTDVIVITNTTPFTSGDYIFTGNPIILPGVDGQYLTITNLSNADLQFYRGTNYGIHSQNNVFTVSSDIKWDQNYVGYFRFNGPTGQWDTIGGWPIIQTGSEVTVLPAPWSAPNTNGVQLLSISVKEALAVEMLPYILDNWQRLMPKALSNAASPVIIVP
jgi:hypothetical protein